MYTTLWYKCTGERKAIFEDCESEKTENKDRIKKLKDEVRDLQAEVQASNKSSEGILRHVQVCYLLPFHPFPYSSAITQKLILFLLMFTSCTGEKIPWYKRSEKEVRWPCCRMLGFQGARFKKKVKQITLSGKNEATKNWISNERIRKSSNDQCRDWEGGRDSRRLCWRPTS